LDSFFGDGRDLGYPYLLIRVAVRQLDPGVMVLLRTGPASLLLAPLVITRRQIPVLIKNLRWIILFGVVEFGIRGTAWQRQNDISRVP